jgi:hypothetical protein
MMLAAAMLLVLVRERSVGIAHPAEPDRDLQMAENLAPRGGES